ncbi:hypothetical protein D3C81_2220270 [compost metagenome]
MLLKRERPVIQRAQPQPQLITVFNYHCWSKCSHFSVQLLQMPEPARQVSGKITAFTGAHLQQGLKALLQPLFKHP